MSNLFHKIYVNLQRFLGQLSTKRYVRGVNNSVQCHRTAMLDNCNIEIVGNNNIIDISEQVKLTGVRILILGDDNRIEIKDHVKMSKCSELWIEDNGNQIVVGSFTGFAGDVHVYATEGKTITIGSHCLFSKDIDLRTGDSHSIIEVTTCDRINIAENIVIGDNVWVGAHCAVLKGSRIADGCILGTHSVVSKRCDVSPQALICGNPAKIVRHNVTWNPERI